MPCTYARNFAISLHWAEQVCKHGVAKEMTIPEGACHVQALIEDGLLFRMQTCLVLRGRPMVVAFPLYMWAHHVGLKHGSWLVQELSRMKYWYGPASDTHQYVWAAPYHV